MKAYAASHIGKIRSINQDAYYLPRIGESFVVVADGMGGHKAGEVASNMAIEEFTRWLRCAPRPNEEALRYAVAEANRIVYLNARLRQDRAGMGTTLTAIWLSDDKALLTHIGDSRAYLLREREFVQMSHDHSLVSEMVAQGQITPEEARVHPRRNFITRALGTNVRVKPDIECFERMDGDVWLLCSDGMTNHVTDEELRDILNGADDWPEKLESMVALALARGGTDNITVLVLACEEGVL